MRQIIFYSLCFLSFGMFAKMTPEQYVEKYKEAAIREMKRSGVPASITLSQGMLESGNGNSELARKANNHFGIKCHSDWKGPSVRMDDDAKNECFRKYKSVYDSYVDHSDFLMNRKRYAFLFDLKITDYKGWARGLKKAGYATNPKYPQLLIRIIERHQLHLYDKGQKPVKKLESPEEIVIGKDNHKIRLSENRVKYIVIRKGDTFHSLEQELGVRESRFRRYNNMGKSVQLKEKQRLYLQPKRRQAKTNYHNVVDESLWEISQLYAVKMKKLRKWNNFDDAHEVQPGDKIQLRRRVR